MACNIYTNAPHENRLLLRSLSFASRYFNILPIEGQIQDNTEQDPMDLSLSRQERLTMHYRVIPLEKSKFTLSECLFSEISPSSAPLFNYGEKLDFICIEQAYKQFLSKLRIHEEKVARERALEEAQELQPRSIHQIRRDNLSSMDVKNFALHGVSQDGEKIPSFHPTSAANLCPIGDDQWSMSAVCEWSVTSGEGDGDGQDMVYGEHHLSQLIVQPNVQKEKMCPVTITATHETDIQHDFSTGVLVSFVLLALCS